MRIPPTPLWKLAADTGPHMKLAALSGAAAVMLGAYGAHSKIYVFLYFLCLKLFKLFKNCLTLILHNFRAIS